MTAVAASEGKKKEANEKTFGRPASARARQFVRKLVRKFCSKVKKYLLMCCILFPEMYNNLIVQKIMLLFKIKVEIFYIGLFSRVG